MMLEEAGLTAGRLHTIQRLYAAFERRETMQHRRLIVRGHLVDHVHPRVGQIHVAVGVDGHVVREVRRRIARRADHGLLRRSSSSGQRGRRTVACGLAGGALCSAPAAGVLRAGRHGTSALARRACGIHGGRDASCAGRQPKRRQAQSSPVLNLIVCVRSKSLASRGRRCTEWPRQRAWGLLTLGRILRAQP